MTHVMIDLETLGTTADTVILTIGAVAFSSKSWQTYTPKFYKRLDVGPQIRAGRSVTSDTLSWWMKQGEGPRDEAFSTDFTRSPLSFALHELKSWMPKDVQGVWGNGADFDNAILQHAAANAGVPLQLWPFWANRCFRTFTHQFDPDKKHRPKSNSHHALEDCLNQIRWMREICSNEGVQL